MTNEPDPKPLPRSQRFRVAEHDLGWHAARYSADNTCLWASGPHSTELEARRELVLERTRAMIAGEEDGYPPEATTPPGSQPASRPSEARELDLDSLTLELESGELVPIVLSVGRDRQPSLEPGEVVLVLAGPDSLGGWSVVAPEWGGDEDGEAVPRPSAGVVH